MGFNNNISPLCAVELTRTIHPVGQGAFYSENIKDETGKDIFLSVYDCGGDSMALRREIIKFRKEHKDNAGRVKIDALFISHFHCDHINGINDLITKEKVEHLYFPYVTPVQFVIDLIYNMAAESCNSKTNEFLIKVILSFLTNPDSKDIPDCFGTVHVIKNDTIPINSPFWQYRLIPTKIFKLKKLQTSFLQDVLKDTKLAKCVSKHYLTIEQYRKIQQIVSSIDIKELQAYFYQHFKGNQNHYSMLLYSSQIGKYIISSNWSEYVNCLYTGDATIPNRATLNGIDYNIIQIPHHGSDNNFASFLYKSGTFGFISCGEHNQYSHPGMRVTNSMLKSGQISKLITERKQTELSYTLKQMIPMRDNIHFSIDESKTPNI